MFIKKKMYFVDICIFKLGILTGRGMRILIMEGDMRKGTGQGEETIGRG